MFNVEVHSRYLSRPDRYDNLPTIYMYQVVGGFPAKLVSSRISKKIFFHMIGNKSFRFIFGEGGVSKTGLYLKRALGYVNGNILLSFYILYSL